MIEMLHSLDDRGLRIVSLTLTEPMIGRTETERAFVVLLPLFAQP